MKISTNEAFGPMPASSGRARNMTIIEAAHIDISDARFSYRRNIGVAAAHPVTARILARA